MERALGPVIATLVLFGSGFAQTAKHPFGIDDIASLRFAGPVAVSPGGEVLYTVAHGAQTGPEVVEWHAMGMDGSHERTLTFPDGFQPRGFTSAGDLFGTYVVNKLPQLAIFSFPDIKPTSVPKAMIFVSTGVGSASLSPDGTRFAILTDPQPTPEDSAVKTVIQNGQTSLYVVGMDGSGGKWWAPELKDINSIAWSPDGKSVAVISMTPKIGYHYVKSMIDVVDEKGARRLATIDNACGGIAWADDGQELAFTSTTTSVITPDHLWSVPVAGGTPVDRTPKLDGSVEGLAGDAHSNVWVQVNHGVSPVVERYAHGTLTEAYQNRAGQVSTPVFCVTANGTDKVLFSVGDLAHTGNIATQDGDGIKQLTHEGDDQLANVDLGPAKVIHWTSKEGVKLEGIATFPAGFVEGRKYPFIVVPHGGPEGNDSLSLDDFARFFAGLGYVVIQPQYRGSTGYGSDFLNAIYQHFGDRAYRDVDSATDYAIAQGWADPNRLAIMGWSAGGFMTSWTVTQTHRYKAAIEGAGITDWGSFIWTSDVQQIDYDARWPGKEPQYFRMFSAVNFADRVTTPLLILHGAADRRVPTFQGQEYYEALLANGKTVRMVTYPGSGHFPRLWQQRRDLYGEMAAWLKKYNP